jgi:hypothetical protein
MTLPPEWPREEFSGNPTSAPAMPWLFAGKRTSGIVTSPFAAVMGNRHRHLMGSGSARESGDPLVEARDVRHVMLAPLTPEAALGPATPAKKIPNATGIVTSTASQSIPLTAAWTALPSGRILAVERG